MRRHSSKADDRQMEKEYFTLRDKSVVEMLRVINHIVLLLKIKNRSRLFFG